MKTRENATKQNDPIDLRLAPGRQRGKDWYLRYKRAGNNRVKGIDVKAPIRATKSLKNGIALAVKYAQMARMAVKSIQRWAAPQLYSQR